ncbi:MAG: hypothetical protein QM783_03025 [Phycisphaerales bacterium]
MSVRSLVSSVAVAALAAAASAQSGSTFVDAQANIFGYGASAPAPGGGGGGINAVLIPLGPGTGRTITFSAGGMAGWSGSTVNGPDGGNFSGTTNIPALGPISGYSAPLSGHLVGLFIEAGDISALSAPAGASYPDLASFTAASYSPLARQVFFIGDGLTGTGSGITQVFNIPDSAAYLVLGIADAFGFNGAAGYYNDNVGGYEVSYNAVPTPAGAMVIGAAAAAGLRRRRR